MTYLIWLQVQALVENQLVKTEFQEIFQKAHDFLELTQIKVNHPNHSTYFRDETKVCAIFILPL